jgi:hypothetical protein
MTADRFSPYVHITRFCAPQRIDAEIPMPRIAAGVRAFSPGIRITQRDGGRVRSRRAAAPMFRGPSRQPEPRPLDEPGLVPIPPIARGLRTPGPPGARPRASAASRHPAGAPARPCAVTRDSFTVKDDGPVRCARRTRMPAPRQSGRPCQRHVRAFSGQDCDA